MMTKTTTTTMNVQQQKDASTTAPLLVDDANQPSWRCMLRIGSLLEEMRGLNGVRPTFFAMIESQSH